MADADDMALEIEDEHSGPDSKPMIGIEATIAPQLNLAFHQNAVPVLRELALINGGTAAIEGIDLALSSEPPFLVPRTWRIDSAPPGQRYRVPKLDVTLDGAMLGRLTEAEAATAYLIATSAGERIAHLEVPIELLARNQWGGIGHMPEMVAAFVQPNDPAVERLLKQAAEILRQHGKSGALDGTAGGPKRAWELASAVWAAVGAMGLDYALPPPSFELSGQKVRGPSQVSESGLATCLDSTLLFCAALEHCGLNPLVIFTEGHAFAGTWLTAEEFATPFVDDITALRKRVQLKELVLFETTLVTQRPCPSFGTAIEHGARQISEAQERAFLLAIDIRRARLQRIRPLPGTDVPSGTIVSDPVAEPAPPVLDEAPSELSDTPVVMVDDIGPATPQDRLERWQRKLLDLSSRNALINFRVGKRAIKLDAPDPGLVEDLLSEGKSLRLRPRPDLMEGHDPRSQELHEGRTHEDLHRAHALEALQRNEVLVGIGADELDARLTELYRSARTSLQEGGANTLFLALGFLSWTRDAKDDKRFRAPLILLPVTLLRKSVRSGFTLVVHDDEPRFNPTLLQMLRQDFGLGIPLVEGVLPRDTHGLDVTGIWKSVALAVKNIKGWEVAEDVVLATFSFAKYLMWKDLAERTDKLRQNAVVRHLMDTPRDPYPSSIPFPKVRELDANHGPEETFCPLPADSSQLAAVMAGSKGKDFVLVGPPGTGKSQTIANLIAQCLAERRTVLFVSEKIAALDVVFRRLRDVGLGEFCLELHSSKARKTDVLEQLRRSWEARGEIDSQDWCREAQRLKVLRDRLNLFVEHQHRRHRNGLTAYNAIGRVVAGRDQPRLGLSWPSADALDADALNELRDLVDTLDLHAREVGGIADSNLSIIAHGEWSPLWQSRLITAIRTLAAAAEALTGATTRFREATGLPDLTLNRRVRDGLAVLARTLPTATGRDWRFVLRPDIRLLTDRMYQGLKLLKQRQALASQLSPILSDTVVQSLKQGVDLLELHRQIAGRLSVTYRDSVTALDLDGLKADWFKAEQSMWPMKGMRRKPVLAALKANMIVDEAVNAKEPDISADLEHLSALRDVERDLDALGPILTGASHLWAGRNTHPETVKAGLAFQEVVPKALSGASWSKDGLDAVTDGRCGAGMSADFQRLLELRALDWEIAEFSDLRSVTGGVWADLKTRFEEVESALAFHQALAGAIAGLASTPDELAAVRRPLESLLSDGNALLEHHGPVADAGTTLLNADSGYRDAVEAFARLAARTAFELESKAGETPDALAEACRGILPLERRLNLWCAWRKTRNTALAHNLAPLVDAIERGAVTPGRLRDAFDTDYCRWWIDTVVDEDEVLRSFVSAEHEKRIADFQALDERFTDLTRAYVRASLCAELPSPDGVTGSSEWGLLRREMQRQRGHMPLRELLGRLPTATTKLAPCLLMSPLSIAQFLAADTGLFDVVVFDEASQIPVWDAIGAIARGRQVVMVGDPKQLPPTAFFDRAEAASDDDADVEGDLESILDECLGANLPVMSLSWHYRSRHESLIAFSNHRYYEGGLVTFPSPVTEDRAVSFHYMPEGIYEKGGGRINKPEARALVDDLVARLKDPDFRTAKLTAGVVTFNSEQQKLVEDLLDEARRKAPELEPYFAEDALEPVFVKNLENVQGDERDVIYFSITYGPDRSGAVSMNFGPMNKIGGERRLNVAITRARHELRVFSSLRPEQFDLSRTAAEGVRDLKHFLEFAERGPRALGEAVRGSVGGYESPFESAVAAALAAKGWQVHPQVGVSAFRIDLAAVDPDAPGRYLAGIECDGATYHRSATARDRDKLREQVLRRLGWDIIRIWSTDWWHDAESALEKVGSRLQGLLDESRARRTEQTQRLNEAASAMRSSAEEVKSEVQIAVRDEDPDEDSLHSADGLPSPPSGHQVAADLMIARAPSSNENSVLLTTRPVGTAQFQEADPATVVDDINAEAFFESVYDTRLIAMIEHVAVVEGPVREDVLARRIARVHGWARTGARIRDRIMNLVRSRLPMTQEEDGLFIWGPGADTKVFTTFRRPMGSEVRPVDEIALPELIALAHEVLANGMNGEAAITAMARETGGQRIRAASRERLKRALSLATTGSEL